MKRPETILDGGEILHQADVRALEAGQLERVLFIVQVARVPTTSLTTLCSRISV